MKDNQKLLTIIILSALAGAGIAYLLSTEKGKQLLTHLKNEERLEIMKEKAYKKALEFDIKNIVPQYEKLYNRYCRMTPCI